MDKSEAVAALRSAAKACELCAGVASDTDAEAWRADAERVRAIADALERDAARYRWLRRWWVECYPTDEQGDPIDGGKIALSSTADCLDELIDAALAKEQP